MADICGGRTGVSVLGFFIAGVFELATSTLSSSTSEVKFLLRFRVVADLYSTELLSEPLAFPLSKSPLITIAASAILRVDSASTAANFARDSFLALFCSFSFIPLLTIGRSPSSSKTSSAGEPLLRAVVFPCDSQVRSKGSPAASASDFAVL